MSVRFIRSLSTGLLLTLGFALPSHAESQANFIEATASQYNIPQAWLTDMLAQAQHRPQVLALIKRPWEAKPWYQYRKLFITEQRVNDGVQFYRQHQALFKQAEEQYRVPANVILAILGVETFYGKHQGTHPVLDSLYTLGFDYPPRADFFRKELAAFLALSYQQKWQPSTIMGSYAGAMGMSQFISSSYQHYAVDFDHDGQRDLFHSPADAIGSIANYFARHGWHYGQPVLAEVKDLTPEARKLIAKTPNLDHSLNELRAAGVTMTTTMPPESKAMLLSLDSAPEQQWPVVGLNNFYVITRYNRSPLYAMAVYQLSQRFAEHGVTE